MARKPTDTVKPMYVEKEPWEQLQDESQQAFRAFNVFLDLTPGERTLEGTRLKLGKRSGYTRQLEEWKTKFQWRSRVQAYDAAQLDRIREDAETERIKIYRDGLAFGHYFYHNIGVDLQHQFIGFMPGDMTEDDPIGMSEANRKPYKNLSNFSVNDKIRLIQWGFNMAERCAGANKQILRDQSLQEVETTIFEQTFDDLVQTDPELHAAYLKIISKVYEKSEESRSDKPRAVHARRVKRKI